MIFIPKSYIIIKYRFKFCRLKNENKLKYYYYVILYIVSKLCVFLFKTHANWLLSYSYLYDFLRDAKVQISSIQLRFLILNNTTIIQWAISSLFQYDGPHLYFIYIYILFLGTYAIHIRFFN